MPAPKGYPVEYTRRLRDLLVARFNLHVIRKRLRSGVYDGVEHRQDMVGFTFKFMHDKYPMVLGPDDASAQAAWAGVADDVAGCIERGEWSRLRPPAWAVRESNRWWYEMGWMARGHEVALWVMRVIVWPVLWPGYESRGRGW